MTKPIIGLTSDYQEGSNIGYSKYDYYALRLHYVNSIIKSGATPLILAYDNGSIMEYISLIDGIIITGGAFDIDPKYYGQNIISETVKVSEKRTAFEYAILKEAFKQQKPILGICGGAQLINVLFGGSLIQHIPDQVPQCLEHEQKIEKHLPSHVINVKEGTLLNSIVKSNSYMVNSTHHQAVDKLGEDIIVNAVAEDSVIEGIEHTKHPFCLGVQWHPEFLMSKEDILLFNGLIEKCKVS